jgi:amidase
MNRRNFLKKSSLAGLTLTTLTIASCSPGEKKERQQKAEGDPADFELNEATIDQLQKKMVSGELTARSITEKYLARISAIDKSGPHLNSVIELNPDALTIADDLDRERKEGKVRGPLHGIPVLIKDNINTGDKMMTTAGALALEGNKASKDAFIIGLLRESGAVLLGKTNLSEWANFRSTRSTSGWSSRGGQTKNPYVLNRNPCGSSSGSGAAVAANLCTLAIGTETNGSVACPASINGVVGIKPTVGLWSRSGIIPISSTQDTAGPMARTVTDATILLTALAGVDDSDAITKGGDGKKEKDYTKFLDAEGLKGKRIGVEKSFLKGHEGVDALLQKAIDQMKSKGAIIVEVDLMKLLKPLDHEEFDVLKYEFKDGVNRYLAAANAKVKSLKEVIEFNKQNEKRAMPYFKQEILESSEALGDLSSREYKEALHKLLTLTRDSINSVLKNDNLSAICAPTNGPSWCTDLINGDAFTGYGSYSPPAVAGYPSVTVPMGLVYELPVGITFFASAYSEPDLLRIAFGYEQVSKNRVLPGFKSQVGL